MMIDDDDSSKCVGGSKERHCRLTFLLSLSLCVCVECVLWCVRSSHLWWIPRWVGGVVSKRTAGPVALFFYYFFLFCVLCFFREARQVKLTKYINDRKGCGSVHVCVCVCVCACVWQRAERGDKRAKRAEGCVCVCVWERERERERERGRRQGRKRKRDDDVIFSLSHWWGFGSVHKICGGREEEREMHVLLVLCVCVWERERESRETGGKPLKWQTNIAKKKKKKKKKKTNLSSIATGRSVRVLTATRSIGTLRSIPTHGLRVQ